MEAAERDRHSPGVEVNTAGEALQVAQGRLKDAEAAFESAKEAARAAGADSSSTGTVARQSLELRRVAADQASRDAQQRIDEANAAQKLVEAAETADAEHRKQQAEAERARASLAEAAASEQAATEQLRRLDVLERAVESRAADEKDDQPPKPMSTRRHRFGRTWRRRHSSETRSSAGAPPLPSRHSHALAPMRRLANDLAGARGALNVGLVVTVTPKRPVDIRVQKDGTPAKPSRSMSRSRSKRMPKSTSISPTSRPCGFAAGDERHSRRCELLEQRWEREVAPHLAAANVKDLDALAAKVEEARALDGEHRREGCRVGVVAGSDCSPSPVPQTRCARLLNGRRRLVPRWEMFLSTRSPRILRRSAPTRRVR